MRIEPAAPLLLVGDAYSRGLAQARCSEEMVGAVRRAVGSRLDEAGTLLERPRVKAFLDEQVRLLPVLDPDSAAEVQGIADGYGLEPASLLAYLHLGLLADLAADGCSAWSWGGPPVGRTVLVKNRDYRGEHAALQRVFLHHDPRQSGKAVLTVGSLGSPGAFSSGMNAQGLALVDTHVSTTDHGPGLLRYFLMTRLLWSCGSVEEALAMIADAPHAGGGTIVLADGSGACASVELGYRNHAIETGVPFTVRTNHFLSQACAPFWLPSPRDPMAASSKGRHARLKAWLAERDEAPSLDEIASLMSSHAEAGQEALCRHGEDGDALTISCAIFAPAERRLYFSPREPCAGMWNSFDCRLQQGSA